MASSTVARQRRLLLCDFSGKGRSELPVIIAPLLTLAPLARKSHVVFKCATTAGEGHVKLPPVNLVRRKPIAKLFGDQR